MYFRFSSSYEHVQIKSTKFKFFVFVKHVFLVLLLHSCKVFPILEMEGIEIGLSKITYGKRV